MNIREIRATLTTQNRFFNQIHYIDGGMNDTHSIGASELSALSDEISSLKTWVSFSYIFHLSSPITAL